MAELDADFVIIGGGTAGLTIAGRLTEDPNTTVTVLEAGADHTDDDVINILGRHLETFCNPKYDWDFKTIDQPFAANRPYHWARGKGLGGSTVINFGMYNQCSRSDLDNWERIGNPGWNWESLYPYFQKHETFHKPSPKTTERFKAQFWEPDRRGKTGPIDLSLCETDLNWCQDLWPETARNAGYPQPVEPRTGSCIGGFNTVCTAEPTARTRSYATGYWTPHRNRGNLKIVPHAMVQQIIFDERANPARATGAIVDIGGKTKTVNAKKEVVLCAGVIQSPQILELSGIGGRNTLDRLRVRCKVDNPAVGENLQDHLMFVPCFVVKAGVPTGEQLLRNKDAAAAALEAYHKDKAGPVANASCCTGFVTLDKLISGVSVEQVLQDALSSKDRAGSSAYTSPSLDEQRMLIADQLRSATEAITQVIVTPIGIDPDASDDAKAFYEHSLPVDGLVSFAANICHPFSRGSVHAKSTNIHDAPVIDPRYLSHPFDAEIAGYCVLHGQDLSEVEPLASNIRDDDSGKHKLSAPKFKRVETLQDAKEEAPKYAFTTWHPIGTCAMMPESKGGVVDADCRVYGTQGLRVVDASIFPLHVQGNIMSIVYAVAEKMADVIKRRHSVEVGLTALL